jgi:hypothetical protein
MSDTNVLNYRDAATIRTKGMEVLREALGTVGTVYFLRQFSGGSGNWTEERKSILADVTEADFEKDLAILRKNPLMQHKGFDYTEWRRKLPDISSEEIAAQIKELAKKKDTGAE